MHQDAITTNTVITCHPSHRTWGERRVETGRRKAPESKTTWTGGRREGMRHSLQLPVLCGYLYQQPHFLTSDAIYTPAEKLSARQMLGNSTIYRGVYSSYPWRLEASISKSLYKKTRGKTSSESGKEQLWPPLVLVTAVGPVPFWVSSPLPKQASLSTPLETSLHNRSWHWFLKFVSCEVKPYSSKSKPRTAVQGTSSQDKMLLPSPHSGHRNNSVMMLTLDSRRFYSCPLHSLGLLSTLTQLSPNLPLTKRKKI